MTRLACLADIHGNLPALDAVLNDLVQFKVDHVVVAGDAINWGPFSAQVVERISCEGWAVVRGNNEYYLLDYNTPRAPVEWSDPSFFPLIPWLHRQLAGHWHKVIAAWPDSITLRFPDAPPLRVVHGTPRSPWEAITPLTPEPVIAEITQDMPETALLAGHTHLPMDRTAGGRQLLNAGSVGVPLDGLFTAAYLLLDGDSAGWHPTVRRVPFDYAPLFADFERQRFLEQCGAIGQLVLEEFWTARPRLHAYLRWHKARYPSEPPSMQLLEAFVRLDPWPYIDRHFHVNLPQKAAGTEGSHATAAL